MDLWLSEYFILSFERLFPILHTYPLYRRLHTNTQFTWSWSCSLHCGTHASDLLLLTQRSTNQSYVIITVVPWLSNKMKLGSSRMFYRTSGSYYLLFLFFLFLGKVSLLLLLSQSSYCAQKSQLLQIMSASFQPTIIPISYSYSFSFSIKRNDEIEFWRLSYIFTLCHSLYCR